MTRTVLPRKNLSLALSCRAMVEPSYPVFLPTGTAAGPDRAWCASQPGRQSHRLVSPSVATQQSTTKPQDCHVRLAISSLIRVRKASSELAPSSPELRLRTATLRSAISRSPTIAI